MNTNDAVRDRFRKNEIPRYYHPLAHIIINFGILLGLSGYFISRLDNVLWFEWLWLLVLLIFGNVAVFLIHKFPLHKKGFFLGSYSYHKHTIQHHSFFQKERPEFDSWRDFYIVFFPPEVVIGFALFFLPIVYFVTSLFLGTNSVNLILLGSTGYFLLYEVVHFASHLPEDHWVLKIPHFKSMWNHHRLHHDPKLMGEYNFNIVYKLSDKLFGTNYK